MCMKYINASVRLFNSVTVVENSVMPYNIPFTSIIHDNNKKGIAINKFSIITNIDFLGTNNAEHSRKILLK